MYMCIQYRRDLAYMHSIKAYGGTEMSFPFIPILGARSIEFDAEWASVVLWTFRENKRNLTPAENRTTFLRSSGSYSSPYTH